MIAGRAGVPLLYVPLEAVASKYYGESERLLAAVFNAGKDFPHGCLVFLDEIDALATERDSSMHEATRRVLSVLLRQVRPFVSTQLEFLRNQSGSSVFRPSVRLSSKMPPPAHSNIRDD